MKQILLLNPENATEEEVKNYPVRETARAIVADENGLLALLHVSRDGYYKLPGGGAEEGEDKISALRRECEEEMGCDVEVVGEVGTVVEYRKIFGVQQISYCYIAKVRGEKGTPSFTESEIERGFEPPVWVSHEEALRFMEQGNPTTLEGSAYIVPRDTALLNEAKHLI